MKFRNYSVFISSTFADMHFERDYLQMHVFPLINKQLKQYSISLRVIDLRWGVNTLDKTDEALEEKVMRVCFDEIDRSRPFFIGLLGNRYGWIPPESSEYMWRRRGISNGGSITSMEIEYGFMCREQKHGCLFMERDAASLNNMDEKQLELYDDRYSNDQKVRNLNPARQEALKTGIKRQLVEHGREQCYQTYCPTWNGKGFEGLEDFGEKVKKALMDDIESMFALNHEAEPFTAEQDIQEAYLGVKMSKVYLRNNVLNEIIRKVKTNKGLLTVSGQSGSGKSCIYALLAEHFRQFPDKYIVLVHSTAASRECRELNHMLKRWNYQLEDCFGVPHHETTSVNDSIAYFKQLIKGVPEGKRLLMFIDAIDGFNESDATSYMSFYPRNLSDNRLMVCTTLPECLKDVMRYHRAMEDFQLPALNEEEARGIIEKFTAFYYKDPYSDNLERMLSKSYEGVPCYSSPLWLTIALLRIVNLNEGDFAEIARCQKDFSVSINNYINTQIDMFPHQEEKLFAEYLEHLDRAYSGMPSRIFKMLSVSYDGLDEATMADLMGKDWNALLFATVKSFLSDFIAEQSGSKSWKIMHDKCKLDVSEYEREEISEQLASYYIHLLECGEHVEDNVFHYLLKCSDRYLIDRYFNLFYKYRERAIEEIVQVCEVFENEAIDLLFNAFAFRKVFRKHIPKTLIFWEFKRIADALADNFNKYGKYGSTLNLIDKFFDFIGEQRFNEDIKTIIYIMLDDKRSNAADNFLSDEECKQMYLKAKERARVKGLCSLFLAPITRKYYNWKIFKLQSE